MKVFRIILAVAALAACDPSPDADTTRGSTDKRRDHRLVGVQ